MALRIRFQYPTLSSLGYSIERLSDGALYDFASSAFVAQRPADAGLIRPLPEDTAPFLGRFATTLSPTPADQFTDGDYCITVHDEGRSFEVVAELAATMTGGDDATATFPKQVNFQVPGFGVTGTLTAQATPPIATASLTPHPRD